jgi:ADP-ribosylglycohydrolase
VKANLASKGADQERFLGALPGMPVASWCAERIRERFGTIDDYHQRVFAGGAEIKAGEFTDESEVALFIVESFTVHQQAVGSSPTRLTQEKA